MGVIPIVNENDTICNQHSRYGDNDTLSGITAGIVSIKWFKQNLLYLLFYLILQYEIANTFLPILNIYIYFFYYIYTYINKYVFFFFE